MFNIFRRNPGRELALLGAQKRRERGAIDQQQYERRKRAIVDEQRRKLGLPAWEWRD